MLLAALAVIGAAPAQVPPSAAKIASYSGLLAAAARGDAREIARLVASHAVLAVSERNDPDPSSEAR
jgi:hypothetical protein